jgi:DUF2075 family protein
MAIEARSILARNIRDLYHNSVIDDDHNFRFNSKEVPDEVLIIDQELIDKAFNLYLRKGISKPYIYLSKF